jgi:hypothetical protein
LSHAEIETYLEEWAKSIARVAELTWTSSGKIAKPLSFLLATLGERIEVARTFSGPKNADSPQQLVEISVKLFQKYYKLIKDNNGIKEKNILTLLGPLGVPASAFGLTLLPNLNSLGVLRGEHAHLSGKAVQAALDPETEYNRVTSLVNELMTLDSWFVACKQRIR